MKVNIKLKDTDIVKAVKSIRIIVDARENANSKILEYFDKKKIPYVVRKLDFGDYSAEILKNEEIGLPFDVSMEKTVAIELKHSGASGLDEIAGNFTEGRLAFENEFIRSIPSGAIMYLVISNGSWSDIKNHKYRSLMNENAMYNSLLSWERKYNIHIHFCNEEDLGMHIYKILATNMKKILEE